MGENVFELFWHKSQEPPPSDQGHLPAIVIPQVLVPFQGHVRFMLLTADRSKEELDLNNSAHSVVGVLFSRCCV